MLKGNQYALPRRVCGTQQHTWYTCIVGADKSLDLQLFYTVSLKTVPL